MELASTEEIKFWADKAYRINMPVLFCYIISIYLLVLWKEFNVPLILPIILNLICKFISALKLYKIIRLYPSEKPFLYTLTSEILFYILLIPVSYDKFKLIYAGVPLYTSNFLISFIDYKNPSNFSLFVYFISTIVNWAKSLVIICVGLKLENVIEWDWGYLFWPIWITNGISLLLGGVYLIAFIFTGCKHFKASIGQLWGIFSLIIYPISLILLILGFSSLFDKNSSVFMHFYLISAFFLLFHFILTIILKKIIVNFFVDFFSQHTDNKPQHSIKRIIKTVKSTLKLFKINSTLYSLDKKDKKADKSLKDSVKDCVICCENECDSVFMPCGHAGVCSVCGLKLLETTKLCHICRKVIEKVLMIQKDEDKIIVVTEMESEG